MSNSFNHQSFLKAGAEKEQEFANLLVLRNGGVISHSDRSTDIKDHIDLFWTKDNKTFSFDVKGLKRVIDQILIPIVVFIGLKLVM